MNQAKRSCEHPRSCCLHMFFFFFAACFRSFTRDRARAVCVNTPKIDGRGMHLTVVKPYSAARARREQRRTDRTPQHHRRTALELDALRPAPLPNAAALSQAGDMP